MMHSVANQGIDDDESLGFLGRRQVQEGTHNNPMWPDAPPRLMPAAVTPMTPTGEIDREGLARLLAFFCAAGVDGVVIAGTNGEGPSLSAVEKRDLARDAVALSTGLPRPLPVILGIATPSLTEAQWLARQAIKSGCAATLVMPPGYFRGAQDEGIVAFLLAVADSGQGPMLAYNYPQLTGMTLTPEMIAKLAEHPNIVGFKDSSGEPKNLPAYRAAAPASSLYVGNETLLPQALAHGWSGTISGAGNLVPTWLRSILDDEAESAEAKFALLKPVLDVIRAAPQPESNKAALHALGVLSHPHPRLPLQPVGNPGPILAALQKLGLEPHRLGLPPTRSIW